MSQKLDICKADLEKYYIEDQMLVKDIAALYNCNYNTISAYLSKFSIPKRTTHPWTVEQNKKNKKKYNHYDLSGEYGIGWTSNTNQEFYFDIEDYDKIKDICWSESDEGYIIGVNPENQKKVRMHNLVTGFSYVDHIKHKLYDNRKSQLREATDLYNARNRTTPVTNRSGCKGVCWCKKSNKWRSYITVNKHHIELGLFLDFEQAVQVRKSAEEKYYQEWSYDNSMKQKED